MRATIFTKFFNILDGQDAACIIKDQIDRARRNCPNGYLKCNFKAPWYKRILGIKKHPIIALYAQGTNGGFGLNGDLPWPKNQLDMDYFRWLTYHGVVIMGSATYLSIPFNTRPLPHRKNIVITSNPRSISGVDDISLHVAASFQEAVRKARKMKLPIFVIGGRKVLDEAMPYCNYASITLIPYEGKFTVASPPHPDFELDFLCEPLTKEPKDPTQIAFLINTKVKELE